MTEDRKIQRLNSLFGRFFVTFQFFRLGFLSYYVFDGSLVLYEANGRHTQIRRGTGRQRLRLDIRVGIVGAFFISNVECESKVEGSVAVLVG